MQRVSALTTRFNNLYHHGPFKSPGDLSRIYNDIDVVVACYDTDSLNERIAEPNKLYEAILFCRPIVVSEGTYLAKRVADYGCGFSIDPSTTDSVLVFLQTLSLERLSSISLHEKNIDVNEVLNDAMPLIKVLK